MLPISFAAFPREKLPARQDAGSCSLRHPRDQVRAGERRICFRLVGETHCAMSAPFGRWPDLTAHNLTAGCDGSV